jgi:hypothetical protein
MMARLMSQRMAASSSATLALTLTCLWWAPARLATLQQLARFAFGSGLAKARDRAGGARVGRPGAEPRSPSNARAG